MREEIWGNLPTELVITQIQHPDMIGYTTGNCTCEVVLVSCKPRESHHVPDSLVFSHSIYFLKEAKSRSWRNLMNLSGTVPVRWFWLRSSRVRFPYLNTPGGIVPLNWLPDNTNSSKELAILTETSPFNLLELRFKLLNLGKEPKSELKFPSVKRLKDKSRTSNCGRPENSLSLWDNWLLLRLSDSNPFFMWQEVVENLSPKSVKLFLERSRDNKVSRRHKEARMEGLDMP